MQLPFQQTLVRDLSIMQSKWKSILDPVLGNPTTNMAILENVALATGNNKVPHLLQRIQQGWIITDIQGVASIYRNRPFENIYLFLNASAPVIVNIGVF